MKRKFSKTRLGKLIFWPIHIIGALSIWYGLMLLLDYNEALKNDFENLRANNCIRDTSIFLRSDLKACYVYENNISSYQDNVLHYILAGVLLILVYWIFRWLYNYLFPKQNN